MRIQPANIENSKQTFGMRLSEQAAGELIKKYKSYGATNKEVAQFMKQIRGIASDEYKLMNVKCETKVSCYDGGADMHITSGMRIKKDQNFSSYKSEKEYLLDEKYLNDIVRDYLPKAKEFFTNHIISAVKKSVKNFDLTVSSVDKYEAIINSVGK